MLTSKHLNIFCFNLNYTKYYINDILTLHLLLKRVLGEICIYNKYEIKIKHNETERMVPLISIQLILTYSHKHGKLFLLKELNIYEWLLVRIELKPLFYVIR